jgi:hypothetical protein
LEEAELCPATISQFHSHGGVLLVANAETRAAAATSSSLPPLILSEMLLFCFFSFIRGVVAVDDNAASLSPLHVVIVSVGFPH